MKYLIYLILAFLAFGFFIRIFSEKVSDSKVLNKTLGEISEKTKQDTSNEYIRSRLKKIKDDINRKKPPVAVKVRYQTENSVNIVKNGSFDENLKNWNEKKLQPVTPLSVITVSQDKRKNLMLSRGDSKGKLSGMEIRQDVSADVKDAFRLTFALDISISRHTLGNTGLIHDRKLDSWGDAPVYIKIDYVDVNGKEQKWQWNFLTRHNLDTVLVNYSLIEVNKWQHVEVDLFDPVVWQTPNPVERTPLPPPVAVKSITVGGSGLEFLSAVDNIQFRIHKKSPVLTVPYEKGGVYLSDLSVKKSAESKTGDMDVILSVKNFQTHGKNMFRYKLLKKVSYPSGRLIRPLSSLRARAGSIDPGTEKRAECPTRISGYAPLAGRKGIVKVELTDRNTGSHAVGISEFTMPLEAKKAEEAQIPEKTAPEKQEKSDPAESSPSGEGEEGGVRQKKPVNNINEG